VLNASPRVAPATEAPRPRSPVPNTERPTSDLSDMEIPTFIRRQMD
jgi:hypothetical protein